MPCSPAQLEANRRNAARSTGPRTDAGKEISRRNGLKHGLTGRGIVLPEEDAEEVDRRFAALEDELRPTSGIERELVKRVALMTVRLDRSAEHEAAAAAHRMRVAVAEADDARLAEAEHLYSWIAAEPATNARRLRRTPEGLARIIEAMEGLRSDLDHPEGCRWDFAHDDHLHHLMGLRQVDVPTTRYHALSEAIQGRFRHLGEGDRAELGAHDRQCWAAGKLLERVEVEIAALKAQLADFDREALDRDRAEAPARALFDGSKDAVLARKYEAATERGLYRALRELREVRAESPEVEEEVEVASEPAEESGSCSPEPRGEINGDADGDSTSATDAPPAVRRRPDLEKLARKDRRRGRVR